MDIRPIKTEQDLQDALAEITRLMDLNPEFGSPEGDRMDILATLVERYEATHYPIEPLDPIDAIAVRMQDKPISAAELDALLGAPGVTADLLARRRPLTIEMVRILAHALNLPADVLIQPYRLTVAAE